MHAYDSSLRALALALSMILVGCDSADPVSTTTTPDGSSSTGTKPDGGSSTTPPASAPDAITEAVLAACPESATLIQSTEWPSCLAGRRVAGTEPFNNSSCELKIGQSGAFEYWRGGALALSIAERSVWRSPTGTYQNQVSAGRRMFLAGVAPDLPVVEGKARVVNLDLTFVSLADDKVEIDYMDESLVRKTYVCQVNVL